MDLIGIIFYGLVNVAMVAYYLRGRTEFYHFPFWAGIIAMGWFFPQAIGGYVHRDQFPENAYGNSLLFAFLCSCALWVGYQMACSREPDRGSWLDATFEVDSLYRAGALLCLFGFFFQWKVWSLPEEVLAQSQWSGAVVKYLFLASVFKFGFITLWLLYLTQHRLVVPRFLVFIVPALLALSYVAFVMGRRAAMMDLVAYIAVSIWFVRGRPIPRWLIISGGIAGLLLVNSIGTYRSIMRQSDVPLTERFSSAMKADYAGASEGLIEEPGGEFKNYLYSRQVYADEKKFDYGTFHWNKLIFNYVPGQIVGADFKKSLMVPYKIKWRDIALEKYGHRYATGTTSTGYSDAFASFGWLGFMKFLLIGMIMGILYRHAMNGSFLGQLLYVYNLGTAMHAVSHGTNRILLSSWVYFFMLAFPVFYFAKVKREQSS